MNLKTTISQCSKNYGSPTCVTRLKVAPNKADPIRIKDPDSRLKGTNGRQKTYEIFHVYSIFYSGFMCQTTVIF